MEIQSKINSFSKNLNTFWKKLLTFTELLFYVKKWAIIQIFQNKSIIFGITNYWNTLQAF